MLFIIAVFGGLYLINQFAQDEGEQVIGYIGLGLLLTFIATGSL